MLAFAGFLENSLDAATNPWAQSLAWAMTIYIACDAVWVLVEPRCVPSVPNIILLHHVSLLHRPPLPAVRPRARRPSTQLPLV